MPTPASGISPILPASTGNGSLDAYTSASLGALSSGVDYTQTPTYKTLLSMLGPGPNGGLNSNLQNQYTSGSQLIGLQTQGNVAQAMSSGQGRGLGGSSIAAQGVENAQFGGQLADASLLSSLYGQQNQNTGMLAQDLVSGSGTMLSDLLGIYDSAGTSAANIQMYREGLAEALQAAQISGQSQQNAGIFGGVGSALGPVLGAATKYALM